VWEEEWGSEKKLLLYGALSIGRQGVVLFLIIIEVAFSHHYLMSCDSREVGVFAAVVCEYTKAYVRCFPLLALVISLVVQSRSILQQRIFYQLLKYGAILDHENFSPLMDPLFRIIIWCLLNAVLHFVIHIWRSFALDLGNLSKSAREVIDPHFYDEVKEVSVFYVVPSVLFLLALYTAYDTEATLIPLSKYFEEDPEEARRTLSTMPFLEEPATAFAVEEMAQLQRKGTAAPKEIPGEAVKELIRCSIAKHEKDIEEKVPQHSLSPWRLLSTMWPSKFLLHRSLVDEESLAFKRAWYIWSLSCLAIMVAVFFYFVVLVIGKIKDIHAGQYTDLAGCIVVFLHVLGTLGIAVILLKNVIVAPLLS